MQYIGVRGNGLPTPGAQYPVSINDQPEVAFGGQLSLPPGGQAIIPSGRYMVAVGRYTVVQVLDPISGLWLPVSTEGTGLPLTVDSDGQNYRVYNPTGFPVGALVNNGGTGYTTAPTVSANVGGSTWQAVVGGAVSAINLVSGGGSGFAVAPVVNIAPPAAPGVQATAVATMSGGSVTGFTITNPGAGYASAPQVELIPQGKDLNAGTLVEPAQGATAQLSYVGQVTAVLLTNPGNNPLPTPPALSFAGGNGAGATATAVMALAVTAVTTTTPGSGYTAPVFVTTTGGMVTSGAAVSNSANVSSGMFTNRQAHITATGGSGTGIGTTGILDGGLFQAPPQAVPLPGATATQAVIGLTMGGVNDTVFIQPL